MSLLPSGLAGSGSQEEGASLNLTGHTTGKGERDEEGERERLNDRIIDRVCSATSSFNSLCSD